MMMTKNCICHSRRGVQGRTIVFVLLAVLMLGLIGFWIYKQQPARPALPTLSDASQAAVKRLQVPVEIRFYSGLNRAAGDQEYPAFEQYATNLLEAYRAARPEKITLKELQITNDSSASQAIADGVRPFNLEKGDAEYLGIVLEAEKNKEVLPVISPEFKAALEADVTRALIRVAEARKPQETAAAPAADETTIETVKKLVPNYDSIPLQQGEKTLRENMLAELKKSKERFDAQRVEAGAAFKKAEASGTQAEIEQARKALAAIDQAQSEEMKKIISGTTSQLRALEQLRAEKK